jgi:hypothetical protein
VPSHSSARWTGLDCQPFPCNNVYRKIHKPSASKSDCRVSPGPPYLAKRGGSTASRACTVRIRCKKGQLWCRHYTDTHAPQHPNPTRNRYRVVDKICSPEVPKTSYPRAEKGHHRKLTRLNCLQFPAGSASATIGDAAMSLLLSLAGVTAADIAWPSAQP